MKYLYVLRHGETEWNVERRMQGRMDSPLTELGREQARCNGELVKSLGGIDFLWVSPSGRTTETAYLVNSFCRAPLEFADCLVERDCGDWSGMRIADVQENFPSEWASLKSDPYEFRPPGGENLQDMTDRVQSFLENLFAEDWQALALVTHGVMSRVIMKHFLGLSEIESSRVMHPNDVVYRLTFNAQDIETHYYVSGGEAQNGLVRAEPELGRHPVG